MEQEDIYDPTYVKGVFDRCSGKYIAFSYLCSMGFTERWRRQCVEALGDGSGISGANVYDLMAGTGEVWPHLLKAAPRIGGITAIDISEGMHEKALDRLHKTRSHKISFIQDNVLESRIEPGSADVIVSTFGLKTFSPDQHEKLARLTAYALKPGGRFSFIEASDPKGWLLRPLYLFYLKVCMPLIERLFLKGAQDFSMIGAYTTNFQNAAGFARMLRGQGLEVEYRDYFFGCASGVSGIKPE